MLWATGLRLRQRACVRVCARALSAGAGPVRAAYDLRVERKEIRRDAYQLRALQALDTLLAALEAQGEGQAPRRAPKGVYMHGGTGTGKTFVMDLFYECLPLARKRRVHFHEFMQDVHRRLHVLRTKGGRTMIGAQRLGAAGGGEARFVAAKIRSGKAAAGPFGGHSFGGSGSGVAQSREDNPVEAVTRELVQEAQVLCFDEFQVTDIADAMIMKSLFTSMIDKGAVVVATSNRPPQDLYKNGIQRESFLPFIGTLNRHMQVVSLEDSTTDYRLLKSHHLADDSYLCPANEENRARFNSMFQRLVGAAGTEPAPVALSVFGGRERVVEKVLVGARAARFTFDDLCAKPLGAGDFIAIAKAFNTVFIEDVPILTLNEVNQVRRMITLIDELYDRGVKVVVLAAAAPMDLFQRESNDVHDETFAFDRTVSRLMEMQSEEYLMSSWRVSGADFLQQFCDHEMTQLDYEEVWRNYDVDGSDHLTLHELHALLRDATYVYTGQAGLVTLDEAQAVLSSMEPDDKGRASLDAFLHMVHSNPDGPGAIARLVSSSARLRR